MSKKMIKPLTLAVGAAFVGTVALANVANANVAFSVKPLVSGYMLAASEGKCGEGKCAAAKMDTDKDGKVSMAEAKAAGWNENQFKAMDTNGDGMLSADEIAAGHKMHKSGADVAKGKEGSCSADKKGKEGSCSADKKGKEGSCSGH